MISLPRALTRDLVCSDEGFHGTEVLPSERKKGKNICLSHWFPDARQVFIGVITRFYQSWSAVAFVKLLKDPLSSCFCFTVLYCLSGCFCGLGLVYSNNTCTMPISFQHLPVDIYRVIFGTGIGVFFLSLLFCCYCIR